MIIPAPAVLEARPGEPVALPRDLDCQRADGVAESYRLSVSAEGVAFSAADDAGEARGRATLRQLGETSGPLLIEDALTRHPKLRVNLMHAGWPYLADTVALMMVYPQVYVDLGAIDWLAPRAEFYAYLGALMRAGMGKRVMFGSDDMYWPEAIGMAVEAIDAAPFLTAENRRDIFHGNAARFLRLEG